MSQSESECKALEEKLNKELEDFIASRQATPYTEGWSEENWEQEMQQHPMFMTEVPTDGGDLPPLVEALQQLKYDPAENTAEELAENYKEDGNENFRLKKYRWAIDSYSTGLKQKCVNSNLNATLLTNRAAAHYHIGNYRSSLRDAQAALKMEPSHLKALVRGALCCKQLEQYSDCLEWCTITLKLDPGNKVLLNLQQEATKFQKVIERDLRKKQAREMREKHTKDVLDQVLKERGVKFQKGALETLEGEEEGATPVAHPALGAVHLDSQGGLVWPVIFLYPEYGQTDFIQEFHEDTKFQDHLSLMFGKEDQIDWDKANNYKPHTLQIYFEDFEESVLVPVCAEKTLREVISHKQFKVTGGWPTFQLVIKGSEFEEEWLRKFKSRK